MYDVAVIGSGVIGGLIFRKLTEYKLSVCLLEKAGDVCMGASKANSGIVHAGFDALPGTLKAKFNVEGNLMMKSVADELGVKYRENGSLVVAFCEDEVIKLKELASRGEQNGVKGIEIIGRDRLKEMEPNISDEAVGALFAPTGGIICPYGLALAAIGNAMDNGGELKTDFEVVSIEKEEGGFTVKSANGECVTSRAVVNCAGLGGGKIAAMIGDEIRIGARKGEYLLLDRESGSAVNHTLFFTPTEKGKGILVSPTVDGNVILGPTAKEQADGNVLTSDEGLAFVSKKAGEMLKELPLYNTITSFAGVRAYSERHDFIIEESESVSGFFHCIGIESPGLTASPAIAKCVVDELMAGRYGWERNPSFNGRRRPDYFFKDLTAEQKNAVIAKDPSFGRIVCRCEQVTEGEILQAIRENPPARDIDGVKRRTRSGMGRCQGGFCQPYVAQLIARERGIPIEKVTKSGGKSYILMGVTK